MEPIGLFTPIKINTLELPNRIMMSPAFSNSATPDGHVTDYTVKHYQARARSGVGLIMVEHTSVNSYYLHPGNRLQISRDEHIPGLARLVRAVHGEGCKIGLQIAHSIHGVGLKPEDISKETCWEIIDDFVEGARRACEAGFDVIELHFAHTYTLADFISRRTNRRTDEFGGDIYGRMRIHMEIISRIRKLLGDDYPLFARFSADEFIIGGNTLRQTRIFAQELEKAKIDCLDVTAGVRFDDSGLKGYSDIRGKPTIEYPDGPNVYLAEDIKKHVSIPVIAVGKLGNPEFAESVIREGRADMIAMARPLLADPMWVDKVRRGRTELIRTCVCCNNCLYKRRHEDDPVRCMERDCARCLTCLRICPYDIPRINEKGVLEFDRDWCDECGLCAGICPARAVRFQEDPKYDWIKEEVFPEIKGCEKKPTVLLLTCRGGPFIVDIESMVESTFSGQVKIIRMPCVGKLETLHMLEIFEAGIGGLFIAGCTGGEELDCKYKYHYKWTRKRVKRAQEILSESDLDKKIVYERFSSSEVKDITGRVFSLLRSL